MNHHRTHVTGAKSITPQTIVQMKYDETAGDLDAAADKIVEYVRGLPVADEFVRIGARQLLGQVGIIERKAIERTFADAVGGTPFRKAPHVMNEAAIAAQDRMRSRGRNHLSALFDMKFKVGGIDTRLGDMTGTQAGEIARPMLDTGTATVRTAKWLLALATAAGSKRIQDAVTSSRIEAMRVSAAEIPA